MGVPVAALDETECVDSDLFWKVTDHLSVLYMVEGRTQEALELQKESARYESGPVPATVLRNRKNELVKLLERTSQPADDPFAMDSPTMSEGSPVIWERKTVPMTVPSTERPGRRNGTNPGKPRIAKITCYDVDEGGRALANTSGLRPATVTRAAPSRPTAPSMPREGDVWAGVDFSKEVQPPASSIPASPVPAPIVKPAAAPAPASQRPLSGQPVQVRAENTGEKLTRMAKIARTTLAMPKSETAAILDAPPTADDALANATAVEIPIIAPARTGAVKTWAESASLRVEPLCPPVQPKRSEAQVEPPLVSAPPLVVSTPMAPAQPRPSEKARGKPETGFFVPSGNKVDPTLFMRVEKEPPTQDSSLTVRPAPAPTPAPAPIPAPAPALRAPEVPVTASRRAAGASGKPPALKENVGPAPVAIAQKPAEPSMRVPIPRGGVPLSRPLLGPNPPAPVVVPESEEPVKAVSLAPKRENSLRDISSVKVSLEFRDVPLVDLVRLLAGKANLNIVSRNQITGQTTVNFQEIPIGVALDTVLRNNGYSYELRDGVVWVYQVGQEPVETRVFFLKHALVFDILPIVENNLQQLDAQGGDPLAAATYQRGGRGSGGGSAPAAGGAGSAGGGAPAAGGAGGTAAGGDSAAGGGGAAGGASAGGGSQDSGGSASVSAGGSRVSPSGRWSIQTDERSNSLIIMAPRSKLDEIGRLLQVFDVSLENRKMQERIFKLKYIDRNTIIRAIQMVLPRFDPAKQMVEVQRVDSGAAGGGGGGGGTSGGSGGGAPAGGGGGGAPAGGR